MHQQTLIKLATKFRLGHLKGIKVLFKNPLEGAMHDFILLFYGVVYVCDWYIPEISPEFLAGAKYFDNMSAILMLYF